MTSPRPTLGERAYDAYTRELTQEGKPVTPWSALPEAHRDAWTVTAETLLSAVLPPVQVALRCHDNHASSTEIKEHLNRVRAAWWPRLFRDGKLDEKELLIELSTYSHMLSEVPLVYSELAGLSYPTYYASTIISEAQHLIERQASEDAAEILKEAALRYGETDPEMQLLRDLAAEFGVPDAVPPLAETEMSTEPTRVPVTLATLDVEDGDGQFEVTRLGIQLWNRGEPVLLTFESPLDLMHFADEQFLHLDYDATAAEFCRGVLDMRHLLPPVSATSN